MNLKSLKVASSSMLVLGLLGLVLGGVYIVYDLAPDGQIAMLFYVSVLSFLLAFFGFAEVRDTTNSSQNDPA